MILFISKANGTAFIKWPVSLSVIFRRCLAASLNPASLRSLSRDKERINDRLLNGLLPLIRNLKLIRLHIELFVQSREFLI